MYWGGPRVATFVVLNLLGPKVHTQYRWRKQSQLQLKEAIERQNFIKVKSIYRQVMESLGLHLWRYRKVKTQSPERFVVTRKQVLQFVFVVQ